ncbi:MAG: hypothetical protein AAB263_07905 [Planctomycetota bacterium]
MPVRPVPLVASLLASVAALVAAEQPPVPRRPDITRDMSYEDWLAGRDIKEQIYGSAQSGEFDEWRFHIGWVPGIDRVQVKSTVGGTAYPGPVNVETDRTLNNPVFGTTLEAEWILGDFDHERDGWFYSLGFEYYERRYKILYAVGANSPDLTMIATGVGVGMGYAWYLTPHWRYEIQPKLTLGLVWNQIDLLDLELANQSNKTGTGPYIELGLRQALIWHPANTQRWHLGASLDYRAGYAQTSYRTQTVLGDTNSEVRLWWAGFGATLFYGQRF